MRKRAANKAAKRAANRADGSEREKSAKELLVESLRLPRDTMMGASIVTVIGSDQVLVENYRGILEYTDGRIMLQGKTCRIAVTGRGLNISYYTNEDMKIEGRISEIRYL